MQVIDPFCASENQQELSGKLYLMPNRASAVTNVIFVNGLDEGACRQCYCPSQTYMDEYDDDTPRIIKNN